MARTFPICLALAAGLAFAVSPARAAVLVIGNESTEKMSFEFRPDGGDAKAVELLPGESRAFAVDKAAEAAFASKGQATKLTLEAYAAYVFTNRNGGPELHGVKLEGTAPAGDLPTAAHSGKEHKVTVKLLVDDAERRTQAAWEPALRKRFAEAAGVLKAATGVTFEVVAMATWDSDPKAADLKGLYADFVNVVKTDGAALVVGYTSRKFPKSGETAPKALPFAAPVTALQTHVLIREGDPRAEPERVEVLVQQLGRYLGAVTCPDRTSAMRPKLGDGQAMAARFRLGFDPLNTLAMNLVADDLRGGKVVRLKDLATATQTRLGRVYGTFAVALPDEPLPESYLGLLDRAGVQPHPPEAVVPAGGVVAPAAGVAGPKPKPKPMAGDRTRNAKEDAVKAVVAAVTARAEANAKRPTNGDRARVRGDELTAAYIQEAAAAAGKVEKEYREAAFLLGIGLALDDSTVLRDNPITASFCRAVESEDERRQRLAVLNNPTIRGRRDLCQHFVISATLTEMAGAELAEQAGVLKEQMDMKGSSGFSFTDLCADFAGIEFAKRVKKTPAELEIVSQKFAVSEFVPKIDGLRDGVSADRFKTDFVSLNDAKFKTAYAEVWKRVKELPVYAEKK